MKSQAWFSRVMVRRLTVTAVTLWTQTSKMMCTLHSFRSSGPSPLAKGSLTKVVQCFLDFYLKNIDNVSIALSKGSYTMQNIVHLILL